MAELVLPDPLLDIDANAILMASLRSVRALLKYSRSRYGLTEKINVRFFVNDSTEPNGYARVSDGYEVALNIGFVLWAIQVSSNLISEVRDSGSYQPKIHDLSPIKYSNSIDLFDAIQVLSISRSRIADDQRLPQLLLGTKFINLIWFHEIAHILRGHLLLLQNESRGRSLTLWDDYGACPISDVALMRALEYDADRWAGFIAADIAYSRPKYFPELAGRNPQHILEMMLYCYAIICTYRHRRNERYFVEASTHPQPLARLAIFIVGIEIYLNGSVSEKTISRIIGNAVGFTTVAATVFPELNSIYDLTNEKFKEELISHGEKIIDEYFKYNKKITKYNYIYRQ